MIPYHRPRIGATLLAILFASGTGYVLFEDVVRHGADITTSHVLTFLALVGTIAAGCYAKPEWQARRRLSALGCALLFAAGTAYIVTASGARNAEVAATKTAAIAGDNAARGRFEAQLAENQRMLDGARAALAKECGSGNGGLCKGKRATVQVYEDAVAGVEAKLAAMSPARQANAGYRHAAAVFAALPGVTASADELAHRLELLLPFLVVLISEAGTILFAHMAVAGVRMDPRWLPQDSAQTSFPPPAPVDPKPRKRRQSEEREAQVASFVAAFRTRHGRDPEPREVRAAVNLPRSTAHRYQRKVA